MRRLCKAGCRVAELVFPLAYLLFPALQAANLYEFHPVTLTAALLLWMLDFADEGRPSACVIAGVAALACKEEIGMVVALLALWGLRRNLPRRQRASPTPSSSSPRLGRVPGSPWCTWSRSRRRRPRRPGAPPEC